MFNGPNNYQVGNLLGKKDRDKVQNELNIMLLNCGICDKTNFHMQ